MPISQPVYTSTLSSPPPSRLLLLFQLLLGDALSVTGQDLVVDLVDGPETKRDYHSREGFCHFIAAWYFPPTTMKTSSHLLSLVTSCSQPTLRVSMVYWVYLFSNTKLSWIC